LKNIPETRRAHQVFSGFGLLVFSGFGLLIFSGFGLLIFSGFGLLIFRVLSFWPFPLYSLPSMIYFF
jgi:hypothetical protein